MTDVFTLAGRGTVEDFLAGYDPSGAGAVDSTGSTVLHHALRNKPDRRGPIADRLLDDGADAAVVAGSGATTAHVLLGNQRAVIDADARLLRRLLDGGSDVNRSLERFGTPVFTIARQLKYAESDLEPFYEVLLARPDLDPLAPNTQGRTLLEAVQVLGEVRGRLAAALSERAASRAASAGGQP